MIYADYIKYKGGAYQSDWHFTSTPFLNVEGETLEQLGYRFRKFNTTYAIESIVNWFKKTNGYENSEIY